MIMILYAIFGMVSGISTVLFGFGGGFISVPLLYATLSLTYPESAITNHAMQIAVATSAVMMVFSASISTHQHHKKGNIHWPSIYPLFWGISIGGIIGAILASLSDNHWIRWLFMVYLLISIADTLFRPGFLHPTQQQKTHSHQYNTFIGVIIGLVAAFLGVGGSIMTVPMMRRRGASMIGAAAMANPLTLPMAITSTLTYIGLAFHQKIDLGSGFIGLLYIKGGLILIASSWLGIQLASRTMQRIPDTWHAKVYPLLLAIVFCVMWVTPH